MIPKFMLKKLYINNSLKQENDQIIFQMINNLVTGTVTEIEPIKIDDQAYSLENTVIEADEKQIKAAKVNKENPFVLEKGKTFTFKIKGKLEQGKHTFTFSFNTKEAGKISFDVEDEL